MIAFVRKRSRDPGDRASSRCRQSGSAGAPAARRNAVVQRRIGHVSWEGEPPAASWLLLAIRNGRVHKQSYTGRVNAERLHAIVTELQQELAATEEPALIERLIQSVTGLAQQPGQPAPEQQLAEVRRQLNENLASAPSNDYSAAMQRALKELGVADLLGIRLREQIEEIFDRNEITPSAAAEELRPIADRVNGLNNAIEQVRQGFDFFNIGSEELDPGEFEIEFLIPRPAIKNDLGALGDEFNQVKRILGPFLELGTGSRPDIAVRAIASSEFQLLLVGIPGAALMLSKALDYLASAYQKLVSIREAQQKLKDAGVSKGTLESVTRDADGKIDKEIDALIEQLLAQAEVKPDPDRRNELEHELRRALRSLALRIDRGYVMDVRVGQLPPPAEDEAEENVDEKLRRIVDEVFERQERLQYTNLTGEPLLELPESIDQEIDEPKKPPKSAP